MKKTDYEKLEKEARLLSELISDIKELGNTDIKSSSEVIAGFTKKWRKKLNEVLV